MLTSLQPSTSPEPEIDFKVSPKRIAVWLFFCPFVLLIPNLYAVFEKRSRLLHQRSSIGRLIAHYFDFNGESNFPTLFSFLLLLTASVLLLIISLHPLKSSNKSDKRCWRLLSGVFFFLATDEFVQLHENFNRFIRLITGGDLPAALYYAWVVPYSLGLVVLLLMLKDFLLALPLRIRALFFLSGLIYVLGAIGLETLEAYFDVIQGRDGRKAALLCTLEELLEMDGVILFIYALLCHLLWNCSSVCVSFISGVSGDRNSCPIQTQFYSSVGVEYSLNSKLTDDL